MTLQQELEAAIITEKLSAEDRVCARNILLLLPEEYLETIALLVQSRNFGWRFLVQNVRAKQQLFKSGADANAWTAVFEEETKHLAMAAQ